MLAATTSARSRSARMAPPEVSIIAKRFILPSFSRKNNLLRNLQMNPST
jgi:hypothetical protein